MQNQDQQQPIKGNKQDIAAIQRNLDDQLQLDDQNNSYVPPQKDQLTNAIYNKYKIKQDIIDQVDQNQGSFTENAKDNRNKQQNSNNQSASPQMKKKITIKIKNLDTGEQQQIQQQQEEQFSKKIMTNIKQLNKNTNSQVNRWDGFWKNVQQNNNKLKYYCQTGMYDQAKNIIEIGQNGYPAIIDCKLLDQWRPLHYASYQGYDDIVQMLLQHGADVNVKTKFQRNSLHISTLRGHLSVVKKLCQFKIDINAIDPDGDTALHMACKNNSADIVQYLLSIYCAIKKNREGKTAIQQCQNQSLKQIFKQYGYQQNGKYQQYDKSTHINRLKIQTIRQSNQTLNPDQFIYYRLLGKGSFGQVFLVKKKSTGDKLYAMKVLNKQRVMNKNLKRYAMTQRNVLSAINHPFMVKLFFAFQTTTKLFLVMDYYPGGDLGKVVARRKALPQIQARKYLCEIILALQALHKNMIVFRDLKPDNVVIDSEGHCRLTDFGLSKQGIYNNTTDSFCGSVAYLAPQILSKQGHSRTVDWYLVGLLLYQLIVGLPPYYNSKKQVLFDNIKRGPLKIPKNMSANAKDLIKKLLNRDPSRRLGSTRDADQIKQHPFFQDIDWKQVFDRKLEMSPIEQTKYNLNQTIKVNFSSPGQNQKKIQGWTFVNKF